MSFRKRLRILVLKAKDPAFGLVLFGIGLLVLYGYKLNNLVAGFSSRELLSISQSENLKDIFSNPVYGPHKLLQWLLQNVSHHGFIAMRSVSALFAGLAILLFFYILMKWYTVRVAALGTLLFGTSALVLSLGRNASPDIMLLSFVGIVAYGTWIKYTNNFSLAVAIGVLLFVYLLYVPGMVWFLLLGIIWQRKTLLQLLKHANTTISILSLVIFALITPLIWACIRQPSIIGNVLATGTSLPTISFFTHNITDTVTQLVWQGPNRPDIWLDRIPLLDIFTITMVIFGTYSLVRKIKLERSKIILGGLGAGVLLLGLTGTDMILLIYTAIYLLASVGIALMLQRWFTVFPRNPIARGIGLSIMFVAVALVCIYNVRLYYVAWPNSPTTKRILVFQPL